METLLIFFLWCFYWNAYNCRNLIVEIHLLSHAFISVHWYSLTGNDLLENLIDVTFSESLKFSYWSSTMKKKKTIQIHVLFFYFTSIHIPNSPTEAHLLYNIYKISYLTIRLLKAIDQNLLLKSIYFCQNSRIHFPYAFTRVNESRIKKYIYIKKNYIANMKGKHKFYIQVKFPDSLNSYVFPDFPARSPSTPFFAGRSAGQHVATSSASASAAKTLW